MPELFNLNIEPPVGNVICPNCRSVVIVAPRCPNCSNALPFPTEPAFGFAFEAFSAAVPEESVVPTPETMRTSVSLPLEVLTEGTVETQTQIDPRLQRALLRNRQGIHKLPTSSTDGDEIAVMARVTDVAAWENLSEVRVGQVIDAGPEGGTSLVTGRIPVRRIEQVRAQPFIVSLKPSQRLRPMLDQTIAETGARADLLPAGHQANGGAGVVVGVVDFGCDFLHENFRNSDGSSRLLAIWNQAGPNGPSSPFGYGKLYTKQDIDAALQQPNPYLALGYAPAPDRPGDIGTHGTHVADIAAGNGRGSGVPGMAPQADLVFVEVAASDVPWNGPQVVGQSFGDSVQLLEAVRFIFDLAGPRPCVVNLSLGTNGGPHDGSTLVEQGLDRMLGQAPNRAIVIAASNSFSDGIHAAGQVAQDGFFDLVWNIPNADSTNNELELWYAGADRLMLEIIAPNGRSLAQVNPGESKTLTGNNRVVLLAASRLHDPNNGDNLIGVFLERGLPPGQWTLRLHGQTVTDGRFHAWIERDDSGQSGFLPPHDNSHTLGSVSCGHLPLVTGSYDAHKPSTPLSFFSSAGPTRDGRHKPEVSAPGHAVFAAHSRTRTMVTRKSGTSMAAPAVTGLVALLLAETQARGLSLTAQEIRDVVINSARRDPPAGTNWDDRFGFGRVSATAALAAVIARAQPPAPVMATTAKPRKKRKK